MKIVKTGAATLFAVLLNAFVSSAIMAETSLEFGIYTAQKPTEMVRVVRPILDELEALLSARLKDNVTIKMAFSPSYEEATARLVEQKSDFARLGAASLVMTEQQDADILILATERQNGSHLFTGVIAVHTDSPYQSLADLKGTNFAFGNQRSTIGRFYAQMHLADQGILASDLGSFEYLERHDLVASSVVRKTHDAGAFNEKVLNRFLEQGAPLRTIATFPVVNRTWVARSELDPQIAAALKLSLLELKSPNALEALKIEGFIDIHSDEFGNVRKAIIDNGRFFEAS